MSEPMTEMDWTTPEYLASVTAEELRNVTGKLGIRILGCGYEADGDDCDISIAFESILDAEKLVSLGVPYDPTPGGFYDRAVASCVTLTDLGARDEKATDKEIDDAIACGWVWVVHPDRSKGGCNWHASVDLSLTDATQLAANLNSARLIGGL